MRKQGVVDRDSSEIEFIICLIFNSMDSTVFLTLRDEAISRVMRELLQNKFLFVKTEAFCFAFIIS